MRYKRRTLSIVLLFILIATNTLQCFAFDNETTASHNYVKPNYNRKNLFPEHLEAVPKVYDDEEAQTVTEEVYQIKDDLLNKGLNLNLSSVRKDKKQILIKYKDLNKGDKIKSRIKSKLKLSKLNMLKRMQHSKLELLEIGDNEDINKVVSELNNDNDIEYAQPNYKIAINSVPNEERFYEQWALQNTGQIVAEQAGTSGIDIGAVNAWNITSGEPDILVGVPDTGIDIEHTDIINNIYINSDEIPGNGIDDDGNGYIDDINGWDFFNQDNSVYDSEADDTHGTQIAGIIAAEANSNGIVGVAPNVKILPLKFISGDYGYTSDAIEAIEYAKAKGVKIINCSWNGAEENLALKDEMQNSGVLFLCAAGNNGKDLDSHPLYPASSDISNMIVTAAVDNKGELASFSNYGNKVDIAAPGVDVISTAPGDGYEYVSGTSAAAAFLTGTAALLLSDNKDLTSMEIKDRIIQSAKSQSQLSDKVSSGGIVNAYNALGGIQPLTPTVTINSPQNGISVNAGQVISISAVGTNCDHMRVYIKAPNSENYVSREDSYAQGNSLTYNFIPDAPGNYGIIVKRFSSEDETAVDTIVSVAEITIIVSQTPAEVIPDPMPATTITSNYILTKDTAYQSLNISGGTVDLNGYKLYVLGNLIQPGGFLNINNGTLVVKGDYRIQDVAGGYSNGYLNMMGESDRVIVEGNFIMDSKWYHGSYLKAGILEVKGNFTQKSSYSNEQSNFLPSGTHKVLLSGSSPQTVSFEDCPASAFNILEITNQTGGVSFSTPVAIKGMKYDLTIKGDYVLTGDLDLAGKTLTVTGNLIQASGILNINNGTLVVKGDYRIQDTAGRYSNGYLNMMGESDRVTVEGNFIMDSKWYHGSYLKAGILEVKGNFTQKSSYSNEQSNFLPSGTHKVLLSGSSPQTVTFEDYPYSTFNILAITKPLNTGYSFNKQPVWKTLMEMSDDTEAPATPTNLVVTAKTSSSASLSWTRSTDNFVVEKYVILRNGVEVGETAGTSYMDEGLAASTLYTYRVKAIDGNGNTSVLSNEVSVITDDNNGTLYLGYEKDGEEYLEDLAKELDVQVQNGNSLTYDGKTFVCDETNSIVIDGKILVNAYDFAEFFKPKDEVYTEIAALESDDTIGIAAASKIDKANVKIMSSKSDIIQVATKGERSENVRNIQKLLMQMGYWVRNGQKSDTPATGHYGEVTAESLALFYKKKIDTSSTITKLNKCNITTAQTLSYWYQLYFGYQTAQDDAVIAAKGYLITLGYGYKHKLTDEYGNISGIWNYEFNDALWDFVNSYGYYIQYVYVYKYDRAMLYGWLQQRASSIDEVDEVVRDWCNTNPSSRVPILLSEHSGFFLEPFSNKLKYLKYEQSYDVKKLGVEQLDYIYTIEHKEHVGMIAANAVGPLIDVYVADFFGYLAGTAAGTAIKEIKAALKSNSESIFEYIKTVFKTGDKFEITTVNGAEISLSRNQLKEELMAGGMTDEMAESALNSLEYGCFAGDTPILSLTGLKNIDQIQEGEYVLAKDVNTGDVAYKKVEKVYIKSTEKYIVLDIGGEQIKTTQSHLFFTGDGWWKAAEKLQQGDKIMDSNGNLKEISAVKVEVLDVPERIYNLNIEDYHTYFVGGQELLVHNNCSEIMARIFNKSIKEAEEIGISSSDELARIGQNAADAAKNGSKFTEPTLPTGGTPRGNYEVPDINDVRPITRQNEAADLLANKGYDTEMLPYRTDGNGYGLTPTANPDFKINGEVFDCYSPDTSSVRNIWTTVQQKTLSQAKRIVLNLDDFPGSLNDLAKQFNDWPIDSLDELLIMKNGKISRLFIK